ncbi:MAG: protein kinase [Myxococcales bacterium]|nr:protein kinase [Myxococcales bacterium]
MRDACTHNVYHERGETGRMADSRDDGVGYATTQLGLGLEPSSSPGASTASDASGPRPAGTPTPASHSGPRPPDEGDEDGPDPFLGRVLGGLYKIESRIGEGGMGTVYAARHVHIGKPFAVKVLARRIAANRQAVERLRQEAVAASSIEHDNIIDVVSFDATPDGDVFIVMELLRGSPLSAVLEQGPLGLGRALAIAHQVADALHAAHERNIVHRDLKPENIFLVRKGEADFVKVLDFGISKVRTAETEAVRMTKTGQLVGTPLYMSPEQARGEMDVDRRADIYALGVILYEMLAGCPPFDGSNYFQLLWKHANEPPPPPSSRAPPGCAIPEAVEGVVLRALAKNPADRFQTMAEFSAALLAAAPDVPRPSAFVSHAPTAPARLSTSEATPAPSRRKPVRWVVGGVGAVLLVALLAWVAMRDRTGSTPAAAPSEQPPASHAAGTEASEGTSVPGSGAATPTSHGAATAAGPGAPSGDEPPVGVEPPAVELVSVRFESRPAGAQVFVGDRLLGTTPLVVPLERSNDPIAVRFRLEGHVDDVVSVLPADGARVLGRPRPMRREEGQTGGGSPLPFKTSF